MTVIAFAGTSRFALEPLIPVSIIGPVSSFSFSAVVDTGAAYFQFPLSYAQQVGLPVHRATWVRVPTAIGNASVQLLPVPVRAMGGGATVAALLVQQGPALAGRAFLDQFTAVGYEGQARQWDWL